MKGAKQPEIPPEVALKAALEIDRLVKEAGRLRFELLKEFWQAERGKAHTENPHRAANSFKQIMFKARHGGNLGKIAWCELSDFRNFLLRRKAGPTNFTNKEEL